MVPINLGYGLKLELNQKLMMTPELRQAIAILQLSSLELSDMIEQEIMENPVLEIAEKETDDAELEPASKSEKEQLEDYLNWDDYFNQGIDKKSEYMVVDDERTTAERFVKSSVSLHEHLEFQLHLAVRDETTKWVGQYLIGCIDENGYLCGTLSEAADALGISESVVADVLALIQTFDPIGVGARDLRECLLLQCQQKGTYNTLVKEIISCHLSEVAAGKYKAIAEKLACMPHEVQQAVDIIRTFDPKPGRAFGDNQCSYIVADLTVERVNGKYVITVNDTTVPKLTINPYYRRIAADADNESKKFIEGRLNSAVWLIKSIEQRRRTLYNVMEAIIELQRDFFDRGAKFLRPLVMKKVAEKIEVHESTVSRAIANKYVNTPHGLVSLRSFFSTAVQSGDGSQVSATKVKQKIKELITSEDSSDPFSDQALSEILSKHGMKISRRTVAKYREEQHIASSAKRKRY